MTDDKPHNEDALKSICLRCKRPFTPKKTDQLYGEKCLRKMRGQTILQDKYLVGPRKRRNKKPQNVSPEEDAVRAYRGAVLI